MSANIRPGMVRFDGDASIFFMSICEECDMALPHPDEETRQQWIAGHSTTGHTIRVAVDIRPKKATWSPFDEDGNLTALDEGFVFLGIMDEDGIQ